MDTDLTAEQHLAAAADHEREARESFERCDTDGFLSQWASGLTAQKHRIQADIVENGGTSSFLGLFDAATGERVKARLVKVYDRYQYREVYKWVLLDADDNAVAWVPALKKGPRSKIALLGLVEQREDAPARADIGGSGTGLSGAASAFAYAKRIDKGYPDGARPFAR